MSGRGFETTALVANPANICDDWAAKVGHSRRCIEVISKDAIHTAVRLALKIGIKYWDLGQEVSR
jgi:hypothetical protein